MSTFRHKALTDFPSHRMERFCVETKPVSSFFGQNVFDLKTENVRDLVHLLIEERKKTNKLDALPEKAAAYSASVMPLMERIRNYADHLEMIVEDELWPTPKYRELLFPR